MMKNGRKIIVDDKQYYWIVTKFGMLIVDVGQKERLKFCACSMLGISSEEWQRAKYKGCNNYRITPKMVAERIRNYMQNPENYVQFNSWLEPKHMLNAAVLKYCKPNPHL